MALGCLRYLPYNGHQTVENGNRESQMENPGLNLTTAISLAAFAVSFVSLTFSVINFFRDRGRVRCSTFLTWKYNGPDLPETPILHVIVINVGRRPVVILNLVFRTKRDEWTAAVGEHRLESGLAPYSSPKEYEENNLKWLSRIKAAKLSEGEHLELLFTFENRYEFHISPDLHHGKQNIATHILIEDIETKRHKVRNSA